MIREWRLRNFKSVASESFTLRPLTILCGANSSGKSSVLQSMLLVTQTMTNKVSRRHVVLNGELLRLGTFEDALNQHASPREREIEIGFRFDVVHADRSTVHKQVARRSIQPWYTDDPLGKLLYDIDLTLGPAPVVTENMRDKPTLLQAKLLRATFDLSQHSSLQGPPQAAQQQHYFRFSVSVQTDEEAAAILDSIDNSQLAAARTISTEELKYKIKLDRHSLPAYRRIRRRYIELGESIEIVGVVLEHFLPNYLVNRYRLLPRMVATCVEDLLEGKNGEALLSNWEQDHKHPVQVVVAAVIRKLSSGYGGVREFLGAMKQARFTHSPTQSVPSILEISNSVSERLGKTVSHASGLELVPASDEMLSISSATTELFSGLRYLGPLRDDPKPVYGVASSADPSDVGVKGQYTASVLDLYSSTEVDFVHPERLDGPIESIRLEQAVRTWLNHLRIAESIDTSEEGSLGHRVMVHPGGLSRAVDLTNVGVGVSQVLPIIVMSLISERGSVLLFEQPELHLHPRVQSALADFFLAVIRTGRQCIVETHSEYLINRLRLRVAESDIASSLRHDILIYFVERQNDRSLFRPVEINEYGAISDWPAGFFDQGPHEADRILKAAREKKKKIDIQAKKV